MNNDLTFVVSVKMSVVLNLSPSGNLTREAVFDELSHRLPDISADDLIDDIQLIAVSSIGGEEIGVEL